MCFKSVFATILLGKLCIIMTQSKYGGEFVLPRAAVRLANLSGGRKAVAAGGIDRDSSP